VESDALATFKFDQIQPGMFTGLYCAFNAWFLVEDLWCFQRALNEAKWRTYY
jgi:hypothetical protein